MKVRCIVCKRSAEIPNELLDIIMEVADERSDNMTFACSDCMAQKTEKVAESIVDRVLFKNADQN